MLAYLLTTWLVERRAAVIYPTYEEILRQSDSPVSLRAIIAEETRHLADIEEQLNQRLGGDSSKVTQDLQSQEAKLYQEWLASMSQEHIPEPH